MATWQVLTVAHERAVAMEIWVLAGWPVIVDHSVYGHRSGTFASIELEVPATAGLVPVRAHVTRVGHLQRSTRLTLPEVTYLKEDTKIHFTACYLIY